MANLLKENMATYNAFTSIKKKYATTPTNSSSLYQNVYSTPTSNTKTGVYSGYNQTIKPAATAEQQQQAKTNLATTKTTTQPTYNAFQPSSTVSDYETKMKKLYADQQAQLEAQRQQTTDATNKNYDYAKQYYESSIPTLQSNFNTYETNANADIKALQESAARQKASTSESYLGAQRDALAAQRNQEAKTAQEFAALGTIDSGGVGSYGRARENILSEANTYRQTNNAAMANALADIDSELASAERTAQQAILTERNNLESAIQQINFQLGNNEIARQNALNEVVSNYNSSVSSIQQQLATFQYNLAQQAEEAKKSSLSSEFMATGVPQTETDYKYMVENAGNLQKLNGTSSKISKDQNIAAQGSKNIDLLANMINSNPNINKNVNSFDQNKRQYDTLINQISDQIGRLRSGGAINEDEQKKFKSYLPTFFDSASTISYKLNLLKQEFDNFYNKGGSSSALSEDQINQILQSL